MKAVICTKYGPPEVLQIREVYKQIPNEIQILVKIVAIAVNYADVRVRSLDVKAFIKVVMRLVLGISKPRKSILGTIFSGVVESIGDKVYKLREGDKVFGMTGYKFGTYAEYIAVNQNSNVIEMPSNATFEEAVDIIFGGQTAIYFLDKAKIAIKSLLIIATSLLHIQISFAQEAKQKKELLYSNRISVLAGLIQPSVLQGGNIELTYFSKRMSFDYSHGFLLNMSGSTLIGDAKEQNLAYHLPYSTGFGIGYRLTSFFDVRVEPKIHSWEVYYDGEKQNQTTLIKSYKTYSVGLGAYYRYMPFHKKDNWLQGITTSTSLRWWPNVGSSLTGDKFTYYNKFSNKAETLAASNIGIAGTQFVFNVSVGYTFAGK
jgi:hypothetical protein